MTVEIQKILPADIEAESFRIIESELGPTDFDNKTFRVVQRVIHATADFSFAGNMRFHPEAIEKGISAIRAGKNIFTDVRMVASGIISALLSRWGGKVICRIGDQDVADQARDRGTTRSEAAVELGVDKNIGIIAIGNAPTALLKAIDQVHERGTGPDLIVGVPVGFVNASESKELLAEKNHPFITALGRKGGSPVAAAIVNALLRLAAEE
jgi:precorrin-8X/cobalt-precorrin-8 methylmutase